MRKTQEGGKQHKSITVKYSARLRMQLVHTGSARKAYYTIMQHFSFAKHACWKGAGWLDTCVTWV